MLPVHLQENLQENLQEKTKNLVAPGMLKSHYSPNKPLYILEETVPKDLDKKVSGLLSFSGKNTDGYKVVEILTSDCDLKKYAVNLFAGMHKLEESDVECIVAEAVPECAIGIAIMDRLRKAAYKYK